MIVKVLISVISENIYWMYITYQWSEFKRNKTLLQVLTLAGIIFYTAIAWNKTLHTIQLSYNMAETEIVPLTGWEDVLLPLFLLFLYAVFIKGKWLFDFFAAFSFNELIVQGVRLLITLCRYFGMQLISKFCVRHILAEQAFFFALLLIGEIVTFLVIRLIITRLKRCKSAFTVVGIPLFILILLTNLASLRHHDLFTWLDMLSGIMVGLSYIYLIWSFHRMLYRENRELKELLQIRYEYYSKLNEEQKKIRKIRHDMAAHIGMIQGLVRANKLGSAQTYAKEVLQGEALGVKEYTKNKVVNALVIHKCAVGLSENMNVHVSIERMDNVNIREQDQVNLCGNLFDYAYAQAKSIHNAEKEIAIQFENEGNQWSFTCYGNCDIERVPSNRNKKNLEAYRKMLRRLLHDYNGSVEETVFENKWQIVCKGEV